MIEIIPAIDLIDGRCVRLSKGDYSSKKEYSASPEDMVMQYADCGVSRVHVVDLDGAKSSEPKNLKTLEKLASVGRVSLEWGGGIKTDAALKDVFNAGADYAVIGSVAAKNPPLFQRWIDAYGADKMVLGADARDGKVAVTGWLEDTSTSIEDLVESFRGLTQVICTDISKDGMLQGPAFELYVELQTRFPSIDFTVSGGISSMADIEELEELQLRKVIVGKAIYEGRISLKDIERWSLKG